MPKLYEETGFKNYYPQSKHQERTLSWLMNYVKKPEKSLVIFGDYGTGKTHLAIAVMKNFPALKSKVLLSKNDRTREEKYLESFRRHCSKFLVADEFFQILNDLIVERKSKEQFIKELLSQNDVVCLDDLDTDNFSAAKAENLYIFVNRAYLDQKRIIITTNFTPEQLEKVVPKVTSRLAEIAHFVMIKGSDYRKLAK